MKCTSASGTLLVMLLLVWFKSASTVPVSCDEVMVTLDLGESFWSSYSKKATNAVEQWARETQNCSGKMTIRYRNECNVLCSNYNAALCALNQWLILEKPKDSDQGRCITVKPKCEDKPCQYPEVYWGPLQKCVHYELAKEVCGEDKEFRTDPFGDVYCDCPPEKGQICEGADCYEYYQQGPCKDDEVLVFDVTTGLGKCAPDLCYEENKLWTAHEEMVRPEARSREAEEYKQKFGVARKKFAPVGGTGNCSCGTSNDKVTFVLYIDSNTHLPKCAEHWKYASIPIPFCQIFDSLTKKCHDEVIVEQGSREIYDQANRGAFN